MWSTWTERSTWLLGWDGMGLLCFVFCAFCLFVCFEQRESMVTYQPHRAATIVYLSILCIYVFCVFMYFVYLCILCICAFCVVLSLSCENRLVWPASLVGPRLTPRSPGSTRVPWNSRKSHKRKSARDQNHSKLACSQINHKVQDTRWWPSKHFSLLKTWNGRAPSGQWPRSRALVRILPSVSTTTGLLIQ